MAKDGPGEEVDRWAQQFVDAAFEVHRVLGPGLNENLYEEALCVELSARQIPFVRQAPVLVEYKGRRIGEGRMDLVVAGCLVVELKAVDKLAPVHLAQVLTYLKATGLRLGLLINFNVALIRDGIRRVIL